MTLGLDHLEAELERKLETSATLSLAEKVEAAIRRIRLHAQFPQVIPCKAAKSTRPPATSAMKAGPWPTW